MSDETHLRFSSDILRRLGEELNPGVDQGLLELVKNAYDADARRCTVTIEGLGSRATVTVTDDGAGMGRAAVQDGWLVLGTSGKSAARRTPLGRVPAGNKGLGRLAALRLGHTATLTTLLRGGTEVLSVVLDWDRFDHAGTVDEVAIEVSSRSATSMDQPGTMVRLDKLREPIGRVAVRRLARSMVLLSDPFEGDESPYAFSTRLHSEEYADLGETVEGRYFSESQYHLKAQVRDGIGEARVLDWKGETVWAVAHEELRGHKRKSYGGAPNADFDLWAFSLGANFSARSASIGAVREWLQAFGGVHLYSDDVRVSPYGNPEDDWLGLNLSRVRSPEERPSTNNSIGRVSLSNQDGRLVQKTDRSGFIENEAFVALENFCRDALDWMARRRLDQAELRRRNLNREAETASSRERADIKSSIDNIDDPAVKKTVDSAFRRYDQARSRETNALRREVQLYRTLSTAGITSATFAHESSGNPLKRIALARNALDYSLRSDAPEEYLSEYAEPLGAIRDATESLNVLAQATLGLIQQHKRRPSMVDLHALIQDVATTFQPFLRGRNVTLDLLFQQSEKPQLFGTYAAVESIVTNLLNNSLAAFERTEQPARRVLMATRIVDGVFELQVADNGPGIEGIDLADIWLPGQTVRDGGTGLGLTIARDSASDLGGRISAERHGLLGGATFTVVFDLGEKPNG